MIYNNAQQLKIIPFAGLLLSFLVSILSLSAAQAQQDFDPLLIGESLDLVNPPTGDDCRNSSSAAGCSGVLYVKFVDPEVTTDTLTFSIQARAGQEAIGTFLTPGICRDPAGDEVPNGAADALTCAAVGTAFSSTYTYTEAVLGTIDADNPANVMYSVSLSVLYSKVLFPGDVDFTACTPSHPYTSQANAPGSNTTFPLDGQHGYGYQSLSLAMDPGSVDPGDLVVWDENNPSIAVSLTCDLTGIAENALWGMASHPANFNQSGHHLGVNEFARYVVSPENSLEFFPLDGTNYITHAEITEGGDGVLIEYAQAVTTPTGGTYQFTAVDDTAITLTSDAIWLNDRTVWLTLGSSIYGVAGVNVGSDALSSDRHVLVSSTFPNDDSFGDNFGRVATYRAVLTRHASDADFDQTAPTITAITVAPGTESIDLTFSEAVCGSPETGCDPVTDAHFEVMYYGETETRALTISSVDVTAGTVATLTLQSVDIGVNDYLLVRTARNSRFTDGFITDRTIFSTATTERTIPTTNPPETYTEAASGMLHLQSGALVEAIPVITYSLAGNPSISEGGIERSTASFIITRDPEGVKSESTVGVTITRTSGDEPDGFSVAVGDVPLTRSADGIVWSDVLTFVALEDEKMIFFSFNGNDVGTADSAYTIALSFARTAPDSTSIFTIEEDDNTAPVINLADVTINESDVELDDGNVRDFVSMTIYENRPITQSSQLFTISNPDITDGPNSTTYTKVVVTLIGERESSLTWTLTNGEDTNFGAPEATATPDDDLIYTYTPLGDITNITDVASLVGNIKIELNAAEFPGIAAANGTRDIDVVFEVFEAQASGTDLIGSSTAQYTLQAENDPVQYIRPVGSPVNITGNLAGVDGDALAMRLVLEETATTSPYTGSLGFFTDGESAGDFPTFDPEAFPSGELSIINQIFPTTNTDSTTTSELGYNFDVVGGSFGIAARSITVNDSDGSNGGSFTFTVEVDEAVLIFRIKVYLEGAR